MAGKKGCAKGLHGETAMIRRSNGKRACSICDRNRSAAYNELHKHAKTAYQAERYRKLAVFYKQKYETKREALHDKILQRRFGISSAEYDLKLARQNGKCAICLLPPTGRRLDVDHNHETGQVRDLLCQACNQTLGKMRKCRSLTSRSRVS